MCYRHGMRQITLPIFMIMCLSGCITSGVGITATTPLSVVVKAPRNLASFAPTQRQEAHDTAESHCQDRSNTRLPNLLISCSQMM